MKDDHLLKPCQSLLEPFSELLDELPEIEYQNSEYLKLCHWLPLILELEFLLVTHMGHQDQDGGKVGQMSLFDQKLVAYGADPRLRQKLET